MNTDKTGDLKVSGSGRTSGGIYNTVDISGWGDITGSLECNEMKISGGGHVAGSLKAKSAVISGSAKIDGLVECEGALKIKGSAKIGGEIKCGELEVMGDSHIGSSVTAEQVNISGSTKISGDCNAERFKTDGCFYIDGLLNAGVVELHLHPFGSRAREIGGETITVSRSLHARFAKFFGSNRFLLETGTIEGDSITLEGVKAQVVRGADVKIGEGCEIGLVEYTGTFEQTGDCVIKESRKV